MIRTRTKVGGLALALSALGVAFATSSAPIPVAHAQDDAPAAEAKEDAAKKAPAKPWERQVFFGEQHLHTMNSVDAFAMGTRNTVDDAFNFAKGLAVKKVTTGEMVKKSTPYDWCAVTDHAEYLGMMPLLLDKDSPLKDTEIGKMIAAGKGNDAFQLIITATSERKVIHYLAEPKLARSIWKKHVETAKKHNDPGTFTTLVAFEWTSIPNGQNLHHNVFFRDDGPESVFSSFDSEHREVLWVYQEMQRELGHENFSIPHNSNVSNGLMFLPLTSQGNRIEKSWAERSARNSPATEIIQTKGASETHPALSPFDEFAGFETSFKHLLGTGGILGKVDYSYVRQALTDGVGFQEMIGVNPWKFGIVAGADSHDAFSDNEEFNYTGVHGKTDMTPKIRLTSGTTVAGEAPKDFGSPGATAVWADENTRAGIFDGIARKESYGTSGPLIRLRFFGGWEYTNDTLADADFPKQAYAGGVPMGGDLPARTGKGAARPPSFIVQALKDPESGNLDRIQIIKGWYQDGQPRQKVYDVVWSDDRKPDEKTGKLPPVGNTVDISKATYTNDIGDSQLSAVWSDPDFDPSYHAVYYVRVIEIPTPRWSTYDAVKLGIPPLADVPATIQERAWSSPIWYTPEPELVKKPPFYPGLERRVR